MGAIILATGSSCAPEIASALTHATAASRACLETAGLGPDEIDLLIHVGIYRDDNLTEPGIAALIQRELGISLDYVAHPKAAFSFDLMNGACGFLNAVQVASAFLALGETRKVLIVSSDAHPSKRVAHGFPIRALGAAVLLGHDDHPGRGFGPVTTYDAARDSAGSEGYLAIGDSGHRGRECLTLRRDPDYEERVLDLLVTSIRGHAASHQIDLSQTLFVTSRISLGFADRLATALGVAARSVVTAPGHGEPHSSALALGYHRALAERRLGDHVEVLFAVAGAGLTSACAVYRC